MQIKKEIKLNICIEGKKLKYLLDSRAINVMYINLNREVVDAYR